MTQFLQTKPEIIAWLGTMHIHHYQIKEDKKQGLIVDVNHSVDLYRKNLNFIPVQFGVVEGDFVCSHNKLTSLLGCPHTVEDDFDCQSNQITHLKFCTQSVGGSFNCSYNQLTSLEGGPQSVGGDFSCHHNQLTSLKSAPKKIHHHFECQNNQLTSLMDCPESITGQFNCSNNSIANLEFCPKKVKQNFLCEDNWRLGSLQNSDDFEEIYQAHVEYGLMSQEKNMLLDTIVNPQSKITTSSHKI